jgi:hypothetical protein
LTSIAGPPRVEILVIDGCANAEPARELVERIARELGIEADIRLVTVPDNEAAEQARFLGSPSIRVEGQDIEPGAENRGNYVVACRVYRTPTGFSGQPAETWLREALTRTAAG